MTTASIDSSALLLLFIATMAGCKLQGHENALCRVTSSTYFQAPKWKRGLWPGKYTQALKLSNFLKRCSEFQVFINIQLLWIEKRIHRSDSIQHAVSFFSNTSPQRRHASNVPAVRRTY